jgi:hypothetical protein
MSVRTFFQSRSATPRRPPASRLRVEALEDRSVPASVVVFTDADGDRVTFRSSVGDLAGRITTSAPVGGNDVYSVDLRGDIFIGTNFTASVARSGAGDGRAVVGHINAAGNNLGVVRVAADLGDIDAGGGSPTVPAIRSLTVDSFGRFGRRGDGDGTAQVTGDVGALVVRRDLIATNFLVVGSLGAARVGGSVVGGDAHGQIFATEDLGRVSIRGDIRGGAGVYTGSVGAGRNVGGVTVGGSIHGGNGNNSGNVFAAYYQPGTIGLVRVNGSVVGGRGEYSGVIGGLGAQVPTAAVSLGTILIGRDVIGGAGGVSGAVFAYNGTLDRLTIKGSVTGGSGLESGLIGAALTADRIVIGGGVYGGSGVLSAAVYGGRGIQFLSIRGDVRGGSGEESGIVYGFGPGITTRIIGGAIIPGTGVNSGTVIG